MTVKLLLASRANAALLLKWPTCALNKSFTTVCHHKNECTAGYWNGSTVVMLMLIIVKHVERRIFV